MIEHKTVAAMLMATTLLTAGVALAADQAMKPAEQTKPRLETERQTEAGKLSADGTRAYHDLALARLAIFDGRVKDAKTFVDEADAALDKAKTDDSVMMKAEAAFASPDAAADKASPIDKAAGNDPASVNAAKQEKSAKVYDATTPKRWLLVDADMSVHEDFTADATKAAAVADANRTLAKGDKQGAMGKLALAGVDVTYVMAVVPLDQTIADVHQAARLVDNGKFYEASQMLRQVQESTRYDVLDAGGASGKAPAAATAPVTH